MRLYIAGGCGEHGRNCFLVEGKCVNFLVDCGVMAGEEGGGYPRLSAEQAQRLRCVFLTHSHADHTGALPWLRSMGYTGPVIASRHTLEQLPFHLEAELPLEELCPGGEGSYDGVHIQWGRSGHCVGSVWYRFSMERKSILFSGDYTENTQVYVTEPIRGQTADVAVLDCAYGSDRVSYADACGYLTEKVRRLLAQYGLLVFPVPKYGRGLELLQLFRQSGLEGPIFGDSHFLREIEKTEEYHGWMKPAAGTLQNAAAPYSETEKQGILFISDPQLRSPAARDAVRTVLALGGHAVMTGTVEHGSFSAQLVKDGQMELLRYPVHLNLRQMEALAGKNPFARVIPYHSAEITAEPICSF
ncbi:MAG: MBL fold metallo-hydrolase [Oscillospiraceae bacterium]|nr:MBL fold metallo-hydrolase [Oscillospiraceae bacterium]